MKKWMLLLMALLLPLAAMAEEACPHARDKAADYACMLHFDAPAEEADFEDALLIGDSLAYSLADYGVIESLDVECYIGLSPEHVHQSRVIPRQGSFVTILDVAVEYAPSKLLVMFGSNGLTYKDAADVLPHYHAMTDAILDALPETDVYLMSVTPVDTWVKEESRGLNMPNILAFNEGVRAIAESHGVHYVDVCTPLLAQDGSGIARAFVATDGLHLSHEGAKVLTDAIRYQIAR